MRRRVLIGGLAVAAAGAGFAAAWRRGRDDDAELTELSLLRFAQPGGGELRLQALRGRPLLLNFWATWCPPCVGELPLLDRFARAQAGWRVVGLAVDQLQPVQEFLTRHAVSYPVGMAGLDGVDLSRRLGNQSGGLPFTLVFDSQGTVADRRLGSISTSDLTRWEGTIR